MFVNYQKLSNQFGHVAVSVLFTYRRKLLIVASLSIVM